MANYLSMHMSVGVRDLFIHIFFFSVPKNLLAFSMAFCLLFCFLICLLSRVYSNCAMYNYCNGHGVCIESNSTCNCYEGWGADNEIASYKAPDCSVRTCPSGRAWGALPTSTTDAHPLAECSNMGKYLGKHHTP